LQKRDSITRFWDKPRDNSKNLSDPLLFEAPWLCLFKAVDPSTAWILVKGVNLASSKEVLDDLIQPEVGMTFTTLGDAKQEIFYEKATVVFKRWGVLRSADGIGETFGALANAPEISAGGSSNVSSLRLPLFSCEALIHDLPLWVQSTEKLQGELMEIAKSNLTNRQTSLSHSDIFDRLAAALWLELQNIGLLSCAPFHAKERFSFARALQRKKESRFHGIIILRGDYQKLWQEINLLNLTPDKIAS
jgi:hypothetical protein